MDLTSITAQLRAITRSVNVARRAVGETVWFTLAFISTIPTVWSIWLLGQEEYPKQQLVSLVPLLLFVLTIFFLYSGCAAHMRHWAAEREKMTDQ